MRTVVQGLALELHSKTDKTDAKKVYNTLILYEFGKQYPELLRVSVNPQKLAEAQKLPGQVVEVECELSIFQNRTSIHFVSGKAQESRRAA